MVCRRKRDFGCRVKGIKNQKIDFRAVTCRGPKVVILDANFGEESKNELRKMF